jgi:hypothetical protein
MISISTLSARSLKVLMSLQAAAEENGGDFGFFDDAYEIIKNDFSSHQFAGHISDLTKRGFIAWTEDLGHYDGIGTDGIQFGLADFSA